MVVGYSGSRRYLGQSLSHQTRPPPSSHSAGAGEDRVSSQGSSEHDDDRGRWEASPIKIVTCATARSQAQDVHPLMSAYRSAFGVKSDQICSGQVAPDPKRTSLVALASARPARQGCTTRGGPPMIHLLRFALLLAVATPALANDLVPPEKAGLSSERLDRLTSYFKTEVDSARMPGAVIAIWRKGQLAYFEAVGYRDPATKAPMPRDAIFSIASMTKPMVSVAIMMLHEEGKLALWDPVGKFLPALANRRVGVMQTDPSG